MRWACILLTQLAMDSELRQLENPQQPLVLVDGPVQRTVLRAVNTAARELGLKPGQTLTAAQTIATGFAVRHYDQQKIEHSQQMLAAWAYGFSSHVSLDFPRALLLEVASSLQLFGPWSVLEQRLRNELTNLGFRHRIVLAPNPLAARMLCNVHDGLVIADELALRPAIEQLPVARCGLTPALAQSLSRMGLRHVRQLLELPRDAVARRFPRELLLHLDQLLGQQPMALTCYAPTDIFEARIELNFEVSAHTALLFPIRRLIGDLAAFLAGRDCGVQRFELELQHRSGEPTRLFVGLLAPERDPLLLFELTRSRVEQLQLPSPVLAVRLWADDLPDFRPQLMTLFAERSHQQQSWEQLRERLRARLGDQAVQELAVVAEHRPERSWQRVTDEQKPLLPIVTGSPRPGWLLAEPQPVTDLALQFISGPERIESGWWDGHDQRRDYFVVRMNGRLAWVYQELGAQGPWMLHGWFA